MINLKKINDPIYGLITLNELESRIVDTPIFQRLRYIRQLSFAEFVYPTANHNRFSHSLGVFYITNEICKNLQSQDNDLMSSFYIDNLKMAALLHDIGHFPFSHALEFNDKSAAWDKLTSFLMIPHEELGVHIIKNSYIKEYIQENQDNYDIELICNLIEGNDIADNSILNKIINWELDADRLDYLIRDSYFSGVKYGTIDLNYLISNYEIYNKEKLVINVKASRAIENILISRFSLFDRLYTHKNISYYNFLLKEIILQLENSEIYPGFKDLKYFEETLKNEENSESIFKFTDFALFNRVCDYYNSKKKDITIDKIILENLKSLIYRKKHHTIKKYQRITKQKKGYIEVIDTQISVHINKLKSMYDNEIYLDIPKNRFTKYKSISYPSIGMDPEIINEIKEQEMNSIWIKSKGEKPELFYEWSGTYFKDLCFFKNIKYLIYLNNENNDLRKEYMKVDEEIKNIIKTL